MDPLTLAATVVPLLTVYLGHMGEGAAQRLGEAIGTAAAAKLGRLYELVRAKVAGRPEAQASLELLERRPDDPGGRERLTGQLEGLAAVDREFADELRRLVDDARREGAASPSPRSSTRERSPSTATSSSTGRTTPDATSTSARRRGGADVRGRTTRRQPAARAPRDQGERAGRPATTSA
jgi:hypothetical protein